MADDEPAFKVAENHCAIYHYQRSTNDPEQASIIGTVQWVGQPALVVPHTPPPTSVDRMAIGPQALTGLVENRATAKSMDVKSTEQSESTEPEAGNTKTVKQLKMVGKDQSWIKSIEQEAANKPKKVAVEQSTVKQPEKVAAKKQSTIKAKLKSEQAAVSTVKQCAEATASRPAATHLDRQCGGR